MKLVLVNNHLHYKGGAERVFFEQRDLLRAKGHEVFLFGQDERSDPNEPFHEFFPPRNDLATASIPSKIPEFFRFTYSGRNRRRFRGFLEKVRPDLVHVHNIYGGLTTGVLDAAKDLNIPVVMTLHDYKLISLSPNLLSGLKPCRDCLVHPLTVKCIWNRCHRGNLGSTIAYYYETWFNKRFDKYASVDAFIAPSRYLADKVGAFGYDRARIHVVPNALDPARFQPSAGSEPYFLYAGRMVEEKGVELLVEHFPKGAGQLVLAGDGPRFEDFRKKAGGRVDLKFLGSVAPDAMGALYRRCQALVLPSLCHENASMAVLEAMAYGKPVVASRIGGLPEQIEDGVNGLLVEPGDGEGLSRALRRLAEDPEGTRKMGLNARRILEERYSFEVYYQALMGIYGQVISRSAGGVR